MICPYCCSISLKHYDSCLTCGAKFTAGNRAGGKRLFDSPIPFNQGLLDGGEPKEAEELFRKACKPAKKLYTLRMAEALADFVLLGVLSALVFFSRSMAAFGVACLLVLVAALVRIGFHRRLLGIMKDMISFSPLFVGGMILLTTKPVSAGKKDKADDSPARHLCGGFRDLCALTGLSYLADEWIKLRKILFYKFTFLCTAYSAGGLLLCIRFVLLGENAGMGKNTVGVIGFLVTAGIGIPALIVCCFKEKKCFETTMRKMRSDTILS